jgi:hypothetical protein
VNAPTPATKSQLGYLRGLKSRRIAALAQPTSEREVMEVAVLTKMFVEPATFAMAARQIDALKEPDGVLAFARAKKRSGEYTVLLRRMMKDGFLKEPYPTADQIVEVLS